MVINWYGEGCFRVQASDFNLITDPFDSKTGLTPPRVKADLTLETVTSLPYSENGPELIVGPGEYEVKNIRVTGIPLTKESNTKEAKTAYLVEVDDVRLCFLGHLASELDAEALEYLDEVDVLFIPGGGAPFISQKDAAALVKQLEPRIVIPSFFKIPNLKRSSEPVIKFLEELGKKAEPVEKLSLKKKDLEPVTKVVVLKV